jgi:repressor LexA
MADELTPVQRQILELLCVEVSERREPPTIQDIAADIGLPRASSVHAELEQLERKGFIRRNAAARVVDVICRGQASARAGALATVPLVGKAAAGEPILADQQIEDTFRLPREFVGQGNDLMMVRIKGESMTGAGILDGDFVVFRRQSNAENGEMVVALLENEVTVKHLWRDEDGVRLLPANDSYQPIPGNEAQVLGKVVTVIRRL